VRSTKNYFQFLGVFLTLFPVTSQAALQPYTVKSGDTLYSLSQQLLGSCRLYPHLLENNPQLHIDEPLKVGKKINYDKEFVAFHYDVEKIKLEASKSKKYLCNKPVALRGPEEIAKLSKPAESSVLWTYRLELGGMVQTQLISRVESQYKNALYPWAALGWSYHRKFDIDLVFGKGLYHAKEFYGGAWLSATLNNLNPARVNTRLLITAGADRHFSKSGSRLALIGGLRMHLSNDEDRLFLEFSGLVQRYNNYDLVILAALGYAI
jgi:LysM repeat protein